MHERDAFGELFSDGERVAVITAGDALTFFGSVAAWNDVGLALDPAHRPYASESQREKTAIFVPWSAVLYVRPLTGREGEF